MLSNFKLLLAGLLVTSLLDATVTAQESLPADAQYRNQVRRMYQSLTGLNPKKAYLDELTAMVSSPESGGQSSEQKFQEVAKKIISENSEFYNVTLKNFFTPWSNRDRTVLAPLNDMTALMIGTVRDDIPFRNIFTEDYMYYAKGEATVGAENDQVRLKNGTVLKKVFNGNNVHFEAELERKFQNLADPAILEKSTQLQVLHRTTDPIAGIFSTRAFGEAFYQAGTNRRPIAFLMENFMCKTMSQLNDTTRSDERVRRDVDRSPGGDSRTYKSLCVGCHSGMDALSGAFVYYNFENSRTTHVIQEPKADSKVVHNVFFPDGFIHTSDHWVQKWAEGQNASMGWPEIYSGNGAKELGILLGQTEAFYSCMSKRVFTQLCAHEPSNQAELEYVERAAKAFKESNTNMKQLFVQTAVVCKGEKR